MNLNHEISKSITEKLFRQGRITFLEYKIRLVSLDIQK